MNFLLASIIFSVLFFIWLKPIWVNTQIPTNLELKLIPTYKQAIESGLLIKEKWIILEPLKWSIAQKSWLKPWDILLKVNNTIVNDPKKVIKIVSSNKNKEINFEILRNNKKINIKLIVSKDWKIWSYLWENISVNKNFEYKYSLLDSIKYWFLETYNQSLLTIKWLWILGKKIFSPKIPQERTQALNQMSWPIWIVDFISNSLSNWFIFLMIITAIISINLWVFNLLPIPALDGWRFIFIVINWIILKIFWRKFLNQNIENLIHISFFILLIVLSIFIWYNDVNKIINR
jgi:regulator of sigma E protease